MDDSLMRTFSEAGRVFIAQDRIYRQFRERPMDNFRVTERILTGSGWSSPIAGIIFFTPTPPEPEAARI
jgi:hypothetical protein